MATAITTTPQNITGDFDLVSVQTAAKADIAFLQKSLGSSTTDWATLEAIKPGDLHFVRNTGTNSYRLERAVTGVSVEFSQ